MLNHFCFRGLKPIAKPKYARPCMVYILDVVDIMEQDAKIMLNKVHNMFLKFPILYVKGHNTLNKK